MYKYEFHGNGISFGVYVAPSESEAKEKFAIDAGYASWDAMVKQAEELTKDGNTIEVTKLGE